ncbi:hypothetical protein FRC19_009706 [Serendipita sp. 401]|nr:hypothetical protein FRC19_009706 [Serendipita sp. 401]KAG9057010.1 hypothetical protein FS842_008943 [Serendipita sp. 407]
MCLGPTRVLPSLLVSVERMEGVSAHAVHGIVGGGIGAETGIGGARRGADTGSGAPGRGLETGLGAAGGSAGAGVGDVGKGGQLEKDRRKEASRQAMEARKKREEELARQAEEAIKKKLEEKRQSEKEKKREFERQAQEARRREEELARQAEEAKHLGVAGRGAGTEVGDVGRGGQLEKDKRKEASRQAMEARKKREEELARQAEVARQRKLEEERQWLQSEITRLDQENQSIAQDVQDFEVKNESIKALNRDLGHQWSKLSADLDAQQKVLNQLPPSVSIDPPADTLIQLFNSLNASIADYAFEVLRGLNDKAESRALDKDDFASLRNLFKIRSDDPTNDFTVEPNIRPFLDKLEKMKEDLTPMDIIDPIIQFALCHHLYFKIFMPFTPSLTAGDSNALHDIYTKFRRGEPQERAARWRSITYKQLLSMQKPGALLQFIEDETNVFVELVYHILNALNKGEEAKPPTDLFKAAGDIFLAAMKVQERVKTEYISFDYEVTFYRRDIPKAMEIVDGAEKVALKLMRPIFDPGLMEASQGAIGTTAQSVWMTVGLGMIALKGVRNDGGIVKGEMRAPVKAKVICDNWDPNT